MDRRPVNIPHRVLFIGNSYTYCNDLPELFGRIARAYGYNVEIRSVTKGGHKLEWHADPNDECGAMTEALLGNEHFDAAVLQEYSIRPALEDKTPFFSAVQMLCGKLRRNGVLRILLYQTWGRKEPCETLAEHGWTNREMTLRLAAAYDKIAAEQGCLLSPVGTAFYDVNTNHPEVVLYTEDNSHPTLSGSYLAALCHFAVLYGVSPLSVPYTPAGVEPEEAAILKQAAADAVSGPSIVPDEYRL